MKKRKPYSNDELPIVVLAYLNRYVFIVAPLILPLCFSHTKQEYYLGVGIGICIFAAYELIGYLFGFRHIYCSYQDAYHQRMTPNKINWNKIRTADALGIPVIFFILGMALIIAESIE